VKANTENELSQNLYNCHNFEIFYPRTEVFTNMLEENPSKSISSKSTTLRIANEIVNFLPKNLESLFHKISALIVTNCNLKVITKIDLTQFGNNLVFLNLSHNSLIAIEDDLFDDNKNLTHVDLSYNKFIVIGNKFAQNIRSLEIATVTFNRSGCLEGIYIKNR
jgi:hypothetical protein